MCGEEESVMAIIEPQEFIYKINADIIKATLCRYFRDKQFIPCTEFRFNKYKVTGESNADVMAFDFKNGELIEAEVKISRSDLKNDILKPKHKENPKVNRFYYCVPRDLYDDAVALAKSINIKYGVIIYDEYYHGNNRNGINVMLSAGLLMPRQEISEDLKELLLRRLSYENAARLLKYSIKDCKQVNPRYVKWRELREERYRKKRLKD